MQALHTPLGSFEGRSVGLSDRTMAVQAGARLDASRGCAWGSVARQLMLPARQACGPPGPAMLSARPVMRPAAASCGITSLPTAASRAALAQRHASARTGLGSSRRQRLPPPAALPEALSDALATAAASPYRDFYCLALTVLGSILWVKIFDRLATTGVLEQVRGAHFAQSLLGDVCRPCAAWGHMGQGLLVLAARAPWRSLRAEGRARRWGVASAPRAPLTRTPHACSGA